MAIEDDLIDYYIETAKRNNINVTKNSSNQLALSFSGILESDIDEAVSLLKKIWSKK